MDFPVLRDAVASLNKSFTAERLLTEEKRYAGCLTFQSNGTPADPACKKKILIPRSETLSMLKQVVRNLLSEVIERDQSEMLFMDAVFSEQCVSDMFPGARVIQKGESSAVFQLQDKRIFKLSNLQQHNKQSEAVFAKLAGEKGFGPKVHNVVLCPPVCGGGMRVGIVMDQIDGVTFRDYMITAAPNQQLAVLDVVQQAIGEMHKSGIFHRDLHGENIMITMDSKRNPKRAYIIDFQTATRRIYKLMEQEDFAIVSKMREDLEMNERVRYIVYCLINEGVARLA
jgi:predicted Ser/Thr protein kinase